MDEFLLQIDGNHFRQTNGPWNDLCLNDPWSVGYVTTLIETQHFETKEEREKFYYTSGENRILNLVDISEQTRTLLIDHTLKKTNPQQIAKLKWNYRNLNYQFGRTPEQLCEKGKILYNFVTQMGITITIEECIECVRYRTICETWNGIIIRERNTVIKLKRIFPSLDFKKTDGVFDHKYAVDYELAQNDRIICGLQIKPKTYTYNTPYIIKARNANARKNQEYFNAFHYPVFDVISHTNGDIINPDVINAIKSRISTDTNIT